MEIMEHVIKCINDLKEQYTENINAIETGTIRSYNERHESTRHIASTLGDRGNLTSVDIEPKSIAISRDICKGLSNIEYVESDSHKYLRSIKDKKFHFALLDSVNDKKFIMEEFKLVLPLMHDNAIIAIDDAGISTFGTQIDKSTIAQKGHAVWKLLFVNQIPFSIVKTIHGHGTQIIINLTKEKIKRIQNALDGVSDVKPTVKLSANIMALNEDFWIDKQLNHIYDFFDEIVICEGTELKTSSGRIGFERDAVSVDGLSTSNMAEVIESFPDPDNKIKYIKIGICNNKVDMNNVMYNNSTGDYVWEIDADEFYHHETMDNIKNYLSSNKDVNQINFRMHHFIDFNNSIHRDGGEGWGDNAAVCRIFRKEVGNRFITHRPPTITYKTPGKIITREESLQNGWIMYHYGYVFDSQVERKTSYYPDGEEKEELIKKWRLDHTQPLINGSKTKEFTGKHPEIIEKYIKERDNE
jgi:hypothetical protein